MTPRPPIRVTSVRMADGTDLGNPAARERIARALLNLPAPKPLAKPA